ncbi:hypothetical protein PTKIN_Ptkin03bG0187200 [Pterospermum kingtungense]
MSGFNSAEQIANCEDLLTEILAKLPPKTLFKFKVVCKQWRCLISSLCRTPKPSAFFITAYDLPPSKEIMRFFPLTPDCLQLPPPLHMSMIRSSYAKVSKSCAGLLLYVQFFRIRVEKNSVLKRNQYFITVLGRKYFICNPTTRTYKMLPFLGNDEVDYRCTSVDLAFDPMKSLQYKVICICWKPERNAVPLRIYSSETGCWSLSRLKFSSGRVATTVAKAVRKDSGVFIKGAVHWLGQGEVAYYFDVENECFKEMPMPTIKERPQCVYVGDCGGCLNLAAAYWRPPCPEFECNVFEMLEDRSDWYLKYSLKYDIPSDIFEFERVNVPFLFCCIQSTEEGDTLFVEFPLEKGLCYNFKDGTLKRTNCFLLGRYDPMMWPVHCEAYQYYDVALPL